MQLKENNNLTYGEDTKRVTDVFKNGSWLYRGERSPMPFTKAAAL